MTDAVIAVDPGRDKCGVAVVHRRDGAVWKAVVETPKLASVVAELARRHEISAVILGNRTSHREALAALTAIGPPAGPLNVMLIDEHRSTDEARRRYWREHRPRGLWRLVPVTMRIPPVAVDDYVAVILAERFFGV